jgi:HSP20 family protein
MQIAYRGDRPHKSAGSVDFHRSWECLASAASSSRAALARELPSFAERVRRRRIANCNARRREKSPMSTSSLVPHRVGRGLSSWFGRDPFRAMQTEMDEMLSRFSQGWSGEGALSGVTYAPSLDISETDSELQITMDTPGMKPEEIDIEVTGDTVRIRGEHKEEKEEKGRMYHRVERRAGSFFRSVELPCAVQEEKASAEYKDGVLKLTLPKSEGEKTRKVKVKAIGK